MSRRPYGAVHKKLPCGGKRNTRLIGDGTPRIFASNRGWASVPHRGKERRRRYPGTYFHGYYRHEMMFQKSMVALLVTGIIVVSAVEIPSGREGLLAMVTKKLDISSRNLRSKAFLTEDPSAESTFFDICGMVENHVGDAFQESSKTGHCDCSGSLRGTTNITCHFDHVCDGSDTICADIDVHVTLTGILNEQGRFGANPKVNVSSCVDPDLDELEKMCLTLDFAKPDFFLPSACSFSYGGTECVCVIDDTVPCYDFDCSSVLPDPWGKYIVSNTCKKVDLTDTGLDVSVFLPALADFPDGETNKAGTFEEQAATWVKTNEGY